MDETRYNTVFIDTNLDTHLALIVSTYDTVSDLKKRIVLEHALCFPEIGDINVHALKVKRRGYFYHLSESMFVKSAFHGVNKSWFISVDASSLKDGIADKNCPVSVPTNVVPAQVGNLDDHAPQRFLKGCSSLRQDENDRELVLGIHGVGGGAMDSHKRKGEDWDIEKDELHEIDNEGEVGDLENGFCCKLMSGEISKMGSHKRKKEDRDIEKNNEGEEGNLENDSGNVQDRLLEAKTEETESDKKRKHISKKKSQNVVDKLPLENAMRECSKKGVELCHDELMHEGNKNIADEQCINAVSDPNERSDTLFERVGGPAGGSNEHRNNSSTSKAGDCDVEDPSISQPAAKKKKKCEKRSGAENLVKEDRNLTSDDKEETLICLDENDRQSVLGTDGVDGGGKHMSGEIAMDSHKRKKEDLDIGKYEVQRIENVGEEPNSENDKLSKVLEERAQETGFERKKKNKREKKSRIAVEDLPLENTIQECSKSGAELCQDEQVRKGYEDIAHGDCVVATSDGSKRSDTLFQRIDCPAGGIDEHKNNTPKSKAGDLECDIKDTSRTQPAAKKKHKREKKRGDKNSVKEDRTFISDYVKETLGHSENTEKLAKDKNKSVAPTPTGIVENTHIQSSFPGGEKRKGKNELSKSAKEEISPATNVKSENYRATNAIDSKDMDRETNAASVTVKHVKGLPNSDPYAGKGRLIDAVQESNDRPCLQGIGTSAIDLHNAESRQDASEQEAAYSFRKVKSSKDDDAVNAVKRPDVLPQEVNDREEYVVASRNEKVAHNKEKTEKSPNIFPKFVQAENSKSSVAEEKFVKEAKSRSPDVSEMVDGKKSSKRRKNAKKSKDLANGEQCTSAREPIGAPNHGGNSVGIVAKEESNKQSKKRKEIPEVDTGSTSILATHQEINDVIQNVVESVNKITETLVDTEDVDGKLRKKSKKKRTSQSNNLPELRAENGDVFRKDHSKEADSTSKMLKGGKDSTVQNGPVATRLNSVGFETSELPPQKLKVDIKGKTGDVDVAGSHMQASCENSGINFQDYFVPSLIDRKNDALTMVPVDKATKIMGTNEELKVKKKIKNLNVHPSPEVKMSAPSLSENKKEEPQLAEKSNNFEPELSVSNVRVKSSEVSGGGARTMPSNKSDKLKSGHDEARRRDANELSMGRRTKIDKEAGTASISSLESSKNTRSPYKSARWDQSDKKHNNASNKKASIADSGEVTNSSPHGNRLIGTPGATFRDDISMVSADEDGSDSSDATTRTSDNSPSSDYSDGESSADIGSSESDSGSSNLKKKEGGRKNSSKLLSSGMSLDAILRSSKSYKKAKLTASQSQPEDTESQPVDFVPESEPIY